MVQSIKFRASFIQPDTYGLAKVKEVEFKLGLGPCGRFVESLSYQVTDGLLKITQESYKTSRPYPPFAAQDTEEMAEACRPRWFGLVGFKEDHERLLRYAMEIRKAVGEWRDTCEIKTFVYKMSDIHGRIEALK